MSYCGTLEILVVEGKDLKDQDIFSKMDPYVILSIGSEIAKSKTHKKGGKTPSWNQTLKMTVLPGATILNVEVWDEDAINDDHIGDGTINLDPIFKNGTADLWVELRTKKGQTAGKIRVVPYFKAKTVDAPQKYQGASQSVQPLAPPQQEVPTVSNYSVYPGQPLQAAYIPQGAPQAGYGQSPSYAQMLQQTYNQGQQHAQGYQVNNIYAQPSNPYTSPQIQQGYTPQGQTPYGQSPQQGYGTPQGHSPNHGHPGQMQGYPYGYGTSGYTTPGYGTPQGYPPNQGPGQPYYPPHQ